MEKDKKTGIIQLVFVIAFIAGSFLFSKLLESTYSPEKTSQKEDRILFVDVKKISPTNYQTYFKTSGVIDSKSNIDIVPQISGRVVFVDESFYLDGDFKKDEILFKIEPEDFLLAVKSLEAEVAKAKTALELEKALSKAAIFEWKQFNKNKEIPFLVSRKPQLNEANANLQSALARLENAKLDLERTDFIMPFDGRVLNSKIDVGQYVMMGQSYGQVFNKSSLEVESSIKMEQFEWISHDKNLKVLISIKSSNEKKTYEGILKRGGASFDKNTRFANARFAFIEGVEEIVPGMFCEVEIHGSYLENIMIIPILSLQDEDLVWLVEDEVLKKWQPEIIFKSDEYVVVKSLGKEISIVDHKILGAYEGMKIKSIVKEKLQN